jgi:excisionase family DNA binding protein
MRNNLKSSEAARHNTEHVEDELLTVEEAAGRLKLHPVTVRNMLRAGAIRGMKIGTQKWRVPVSALKDFIESKMGPKPAEAKGE